MKALTMAQEQRRKKFARSWARKGVFLITLSLSLVFSAQAREWEYYLEYQAKVTFSGKNGIYFNVKEETRYNDGANIYRKSFFGLSKRLRPDLEVAFYYAFEEKKKDNWRKYHMLWPQINFKTHLKGLSLASDTKLEWHLTQETWRWREKIKLTFPAGKIDLWLGDEARLFSLFDNPCFGENEAMTGFDVKFNKNFLLSMYYNLRRIKNEGNWENTNCLRTVFDFKF